MATQPAETANPVVVIRQNLQQMQPEFKAALPPHINVEKFSRVAMTAVQNDPKLVTADRRSLFGSIVRLAQDGLLPDGREAALVIFKAKQGNGWVDKVQAMPMIAGILKRIRQSGEVAKVNAQVVYENDHFVVKYGFDEDVEHSPPPLDKPRGKAIGAYATAVLKDGSRFLEVMSLEEIEKVRSVSRAKDNGPWVAWWSEMARKTVMRRLAKRLPMSTDIEDQVFSRDETLAINANAFEALNQQPEEPTPTLGRLDAIEASIEGEVIDAETGEVTQEAEPEPETVMQAVEEGKAEPVDNDPASSKANQIIDAIKACTAKLDVDAVIASNQAHIDAMGPDIATVIHQTAEARKAEIAASRGGKGKAEAPELGLEAAK